MSKHTQGPWKAEVAVTLAGYPTGEWWISSQRGSIDIATTSSDYAPDVEEANARLIAAAPELLAALKHAVDLIETVEPRCRGVIALCKGVIAKAEGRPNA